MQKPTLDFWYEFASTYSWLAAEKVAEVAEAAGVAVRWRPFLLGPIFAAQGWTSSPFNLYPAKGRYMWRDMERLAATAGLPRITRPNPFPQNSLTAARLAVALPDADRPGFTRAVYRAAFTQGRAIADKAVLAEILTSLGHNAGAVAAAAETPEVKGRLKAQTEDAQSRGLFGAPSFTTEDGELFWGHDRLEQAVAWAAGER